MYMSVIMDRKYTLNMGILINNGYMFKTIKKVEIIPLQKCNGVSVFKLYKEIDYLDLAILMELTM